MKPLNAKDRKQQKLSFYIYFGLTLFLFGLCTIFTFVTAQKGIALLESKNSNYDAVFKKQMELNLQLDQIYRDLINLKSKKRTTSEHKQMQKIINNNRMMMEAEIAALESDQQEHLILYKTLLDQIKEIQTSLDLFEKESNTRLYNIEQLEKCRQKYQEISKRRIK